MCYVEIHVPVDEDWIEREQIVVLPVLAYNRTGDCRLWKLGEVDVIEILDGRLTTAALATSDKRVRLIGSVNLDFGKGDSWLDIVVSQFRFWNAMQFD